MQVDIVKMSKEEQGSSSPKLNKRILSSLSKRSVAAHLWHDIDIGNNTIPS